MGEVEELRLAASNECLPNKPFDVVKAGEDSIGARNFIRVPKKQVTEATVDVGA